MWGQGSRQQGRHRAPPRPQLHLSNLDSLLVHTTPLVPLHTEFGAAPAPGHPRTWFGLQSLWASYEAWSAYGAEVPVQLKVDGVWQEVVQCYVPYLSGLQLFEAQPPGHGGCALPPPPSNYASDDDAADSSRPPRAQRSARNSTESVRSTVSAASAASSACSTASTISTDSDSEPDAAPKPPAGPGDAPAAAPSRQGSRGAERGSVLRPQRGLGEPGRLLFEWFDSEGPHLRPPLSERVDELAAGWPALRSLDTRALHPASWFAVAWYPLYRIPSLTDPGTSRELQACFLTMHSLSPPPAGASAPGPPPHPVPPAFGAAASSVLHCRAEAARQRLLASVLSAVSLSAQGGAGGPAPPGADAVEQSAESGCPEAPSEPVEATTAAAAAAAAATAARLPPLNVATVQPFAFLPYKAVGATWADDRGLQRVHLPMVAAAGSWVERRQVQFPDFEFFSRAAQFHRPLPSMRW